MEVRAQEAILSIQNNTEAFFFDRAGRPFAASCDGWYIGRGLSGRRVAARWKDGERELRSLSHEDALEVARRSRAAITASLHKGSHPPEILEWLIHSLTFDEQKDSQLFKQVYRPIGILPPDQYGACVIQMTEGCRWNRCTFCSFYREQPYRLKSRVEIRHHIDQVAGYLGGTLASRRSIFFGEASGLSAPLEAILHTIEDARERLVPFMKHFRGFFSFVEPHESLCRRKDDFKTLAQAGMRRLYYGVETGHAGLRRILGKPGPLDEVEASIRHAKEAGLAVGLVFLIGAGGSGWHERHLAASTELVNRLPLDDKDIIFLSPLYGLSGPGRAPLSVEHKHLQLKLFRRILGARLRVAVYDIREFNY